MPRGIPARKTISLEIGRPLDFSKTIEKRDYNQFMIEILSEEGLESSKIEGEILDREILQSAIKRHLHIQTSSKKTDKK